MYFNICTFILQNIIQIWKYLTLTEKCYEYPRSPLHYVTRPGIVRATELEWIFFANNSIIIMSATMKLDENLVRLTP